MQPPWKTIWKFLKKLKIELPYELAVPFLAVHPKKTKKLIWKGNALMLIAALLTVRKMWKYPKCPLIDEWLKMWGPVYSYIPAHCGTLLSHEKKEILPFVTTRMDLLEGVLLSKINQTEKDKYHIWNIKNQTNKIENELVLSTGRKRQNRWRELRGTNQHFISHRGVIYSTGNVVSVL